MRDDSIRNKKIIEFIEKRAVFILIFFLILTALCLKPATHLMGTISTTLSTLLPDDYPTVKIGNDIKENFKRRSGGDLIVIIDSPNPIQNKEHVIKLAAYLEKHPLIEKVQYQKPGFDFFDKHKLLFLDYADLSTIRDRIKQKIQKEKLGGLYMDFEDSSGGDDPFSFEDLSKKYRDDYTQGTKSAYYANKAETSFAFWIYPKSRDTALSFYNEFYNEVSKYVAAYDFGPDTGQLRLGYAGSIRTRIDEYTNLISDLKLSGMISGIGIFLVLALYYRRIIAVILIFMPLVSGILFGFAFCSLFIDALNVVTSFLFSILFGLGVDIGIHMFSRYLIEREADQSIPQAIDAILFRTGRSSATAVLTTVASFFILLINDFRGFSEFGLIAGIGLLVTLVSYLIYFPAVLICAEKWGILKLKSARHEKREQFLSRIVRVPYAKGIVIACILIGVASAVAMPFLKFEWNYGILKIQIPQTQWARAKLREISGRVNSGAAIMIDGIDEAKLLKKVYAERKEADKESPTIDKFWSYYDLNPADQKEKMALLQEIDALLADDALNVLKGDDKAMLDEFRDAIKKTKFVKESEIPEEVIESFYGLGGQRTKQIAFIMALPKLELDDGRNAINFYEDVHKVETPNKTFYAASDALVFADVLRTLFRDSEVAIALSLIVLMIMVYLDFKNIRQTGLVMGVLICGMLGMFGAVVLFGWKFNFYNMITIPIVIGMGEDNSVHLMHRFLEFGKKSVIKPLMVAGGPAFMSSFTTLIGYSGLIFAHHPGLKSIGQVACVGIVMCMLSSLVLLAALLQMQVDRKA